jgi:hypothetical protein
VGEEPTADDPPTLRRVKLEQEGRPWREPNRRPSGARLPEVDLVRLQSREEPEPLVVGDADLELHADQQRIGDPDA